MTFCLCRLLNGTKTPRGNRLIAAAVLVVLNICSQCFRRHWQYVLVGWLSVLECVVIQILVREVIQFPKTRRSSIFHHMTE